MECWIFSFLRFSEGIGICECSCCGLGEEKLRVVCIVIQVTVM